MASKLTSFLTRGSSNELDESRASLGEHLEELRGRIIKIVALLAVGMTAGGFLTLPVYRALQIHLARAVPKDFEWNFTWLSLMEPFTFWMKMAFLIGMILSLPFTMGQIWGFIRPGLKPNERRPLERVVPLSMGLFFFGAALGWFVLPATVSWFAGISLYFPNTEMIQNPADTILFCAKMMLAFGIGFQMPLVVYFLARIGLVTPKGLLRYWRQAIVGVFILSAVVTPSGDMLSMSVLAVPLLILFFASVYAAQWTNRRQAALDDPEADVLNNLD